MISLRGIFGNPGNSIKTQKIYIPAGSSIQGYEQVLDGVKSAHHLYAKSGNTIASTTGFNDNRWKTYLNVNHILYAEFNSGNIHLDAVRPSSDVFTWDGSVVHSNTMNNETVQLICFHDTINHKSDYEDNPYYTPKIFFALTPSKLYVYTDDFNSNTYDLGVTITVYYF